MDILRNIEKKILNIANNNSNSVSEINNLKKDIKMYLDIFDKRNELNKQKKDIYDELYENKRKAHRISYENYLSDKKDLMKDVVQDKTKGAIRKYLECKYEAEDIPDIYTYENISLNNADNAAPTVFKPTPPKERKVIKAPMRPTVPKKLPKPAAENVIEPMVPKPPAKPKKLPKPAAENVIEPMIPKPPAKPKKLPKLPVVPVVPEENVIEPMVPKPPAKPKKLPKLPNEPKMPPGAPGDNEISIPPNKLPILNKDVKECPEGEEISPKTGKCVKKCKEGDVRNVITGRCNKQKIKGSKAAPKAAPKV